MLTDNAFWSLVNEANNDFEHFSHQLKNMSKDGLEDFYWHFFDFAGELTDDIYLDHILDAGDSISDDGLEDLCGWIVGKGRETYNHVIKHPETIPKEINDNAYGIEILYEAVKVYFNKYGEDIPER